MSYLNKHYLFQFCKYLVIVVSLKVTRCELQSPCPNVFEYRYDGASNLYGFIEVPAPNDNSNIVTLDVQLSVGNSVQGFNGNIELTNPRTRVLQDLFDDKPLQYNLYFPHWSSTPPKITKILVNGRQVCYGYPIDKNTVPLLTTINLQHTLTASIPLNSGGGRRRGSNKPDPSFADEEPPFRNKPRTEKPPANYYPQVGADAYKPYASNPFLNQKNNFNNNDQNSYFYGYNNQNSFSNQNPFYTRNSNNDDFVYSRPLFQNYPDSSRPAINTPYVPNNNQNNGNNWNQGTFNPTRNWFTPRTTTTTTTTTTPRPFVYDVVPTQLPRDGEIEDLPTVENNLVQKPFFNDNDCGISVKGNTLLVNGNRIAKALHPWLAALFMQNNEGLKFICGTSLVSQKHVVTAAHCVRSRKRRFKPEELWVVLGRENIRRWSNDGAQIVQAESTYVHPSYQHGTADADIAIIVLTEEAIYSTLVRPICLWTGTTEINLIVGQTGTVVGWGKDETGQNNTPEPRQINFPIVSEEDCLRSNSAFRDITSNRTFCGGYRNNSGPCNGDSGSGFLMDIDGRWTLRGLVSMSLLGADGNCDLRQYVVFTDVAKHLDWVLSFLR